MSDRKLKSRVIHNGGLYDMEYLECVSDLLGNEELNLLKNFIQHKRIDRLDHCLYVSYVSFLLCKRLGLDYRSAARGGLLHDFFLYDRRGGEKQYKGMHTFAHPRIALSNANKYFYLNKLEQEIIKKHMWPLTIALPRHRETYIINTVDKYCAFMEYFNLGKKRNLHRVKKLLSA